jgi:hypothetical protein
MELRRRVILFGAIFAAILIAFFANLSPVVLVHHVDFRHEQQREGTYMGFRIMTERDKYLAGLPLEGYIAEVTKGRLFAVEGDAWKAVAENAAAADEKKPLGKEWQQRLPSDKYPTGVLFFKPDEAPVNQLAFLFAGVREPAYLYLGMPERPLYLKAEHRVYSNDDFHLGGGFSRYPTPPTDFLFPGRKWSPWVALAGLALYIALPWPKRPPGAQAYRRWRVVLTDVLALLLTVLFFAFPFFITGGAVQAVTQGWPLFFFFWPIFFLGLIIVWLAAWVSAFALQVTEDRLCIWTDRGERDFLYSDMDFFQPVLIRPPRWLVALSWLTVIAGKGSSRIGAAGRAMIISSSEWGSLAIRLKNGREIFLSITDQLGTDMIGAGTIVKALKKAGVREVDEVRELRSLGLETVRLPE